MSTSKRKMAYLLLITGVALILGSCGGVSPKMRGSDVSTKINSSIIHNKNLRITLVMDNQDKIIPYDATGVFTDTARKIAHSCAQAATRESLLAARTVFGNLGSVRSSVHFSPHLIANIARPKCEARIGPRVTCSASIDLYWGTGRFFKTFNGSKQSVETNGWGLPESSSFYNSFVKIFVPIANEILVDETLSPYFRNGFDESFASSTPNIPSLAGIDTAVKARVENETKAVLVAQAEKEKQESSLLLDKLQRKLGEAIDNEKWEDAKHIQALINEMSESKTVIVEPNIIPSHNFNPQSNETCRQAIQDYNQALAAYNQSRANRDERDREADFASLGAMSSRPEAPIIGWLSRSSRHDANRSQQDMNHYLRLLQDAKSRMAIYCNN